MGKHDILPGQFLEVLSFIHLLLRQCLITESPGSTQIQYVTKHVPPSPILLSAGLDQGFMSGHSMAVLHPQPSLVLLP